MIRVLLMALVMLLAACGGGGGSSDSGGAEPPPPPVQPPAMADLGGVYSITVYQNGDNWSGKVYVYGDATVRLKLDRRYAPGEFIRTESLTASGRLLAGTSATRSAQVEFTYGLNVLTRGADLAYRETESSTRQGTGTLELSAAKMDSDAAITVRFVDDAVPFSLRSVTLAKEAAPSLAQLNGFYRVGVARNNQLVMSTLLHVDAAAGTLSGSFGPNCQIGGRMVDIDLPTKTFRQEWTFTGTGCPLQGTGQFTGEVENAQTIGLNLSGLQGWSDVSARATLPVAALPGAFGAIAGGWGHAEGTDSVGLTIHPDGTVRAFASNGTEQITFLGALARSGEAYVAQGELAYARTNTSRTLEARQTGTATLTLSAATLGPVRALAATISSATVPTPRPTFTAGWQQSNGYFFMMPIGYFAGVYRTGWVSTPGGPPPLAMFGSYADATFDAGTGALTGTVADCTITGRLFDYDPWTGIFKQDVTLGGAACPVQGSGRLLGTPGIGDRGGDYLISSGVIGGSSTSLQLGTRLR